MKLRSSLITLSIGLIIFSVSMLIKEPAYGRANLGVFCEFMRNSAPVLMLVSCILIMFAATKLRILSIIGVVVIAGSILVTYILAKNTGYSMGTTGWVSGFLSILVIIPAGMFLCCITGLLSLTDLMEKESAVKKPIIISAVVILIIGLAYHVTADWKPNISTLVEAIKSNENEYERFSLGGKLCEIQDDDLPPLLIPLLEDKNPRIRQVAALALGGKSATTMAVSPLLKALDLETDKTTKEWIIRSLGMVLRVAEPADRTQAIKALIQVLKNEKGAIKSTAAQVLGMIKDKRVLQPLIDALIDEDAGWDAHNALLTITDKRFEQDPDVWNKWMAEQNTSPRSPE